MNSFEPVFWMLCALALLRIAGNSSLRTKRNWWIVFGISAGLGLENKDNIIFFLVAVLLALILSPQRKLVANRWCVIAAAIAITFALPNLLWQSINGYPTVEWLTHHVQRSDDEMGLHPVRFFSAQIMILTPWTAVLWLSGIIWLLVSRTARAFRFVGWLYLIFFVMMMLLRAKDYYLAPVYPLYFAAGGVCCLEWAKKIVWRNVLLGFYLLLLIGGLIRTLPLCIPLMPASQFVSYEKAIGLQLPASQIEGAGGLPAFFANHLGWEEMTHKVAEVYRALPPADQAVTAIYVGNYGEASAIDLFGSKYGLPAAISGNQNYWLWGPHGYTGQISILVTNDTMDQLEQRYASCVVAGQLDDPWAVSSENKPIFVCRGRKLSYSADWKNLKHYD